MKNWLNKAENIKNVPKKTDRKSSIRGIWQGADNVQGK